MLILSRGTLQGMSSASPTLFQVNSILVRLSAGRPLVLVLVLGGAPLLLATQRGSAPAASLSRDAALG